MRRVGLALLLALMACDSAPKRARETSRVQVERGDSRVDLQLGACSLIVWSDSGSSWARIQGGRTGKSCDPLANELIPEVNDAIAYLLRNQDPKPEKLQVSVPFDVPAIRGNWSAALKHSEKWRKRKKGTDDQVIRELLIEDRVLSPYEAIFLGLGYTLTGVSIEKVTYDNPAEPYPLVTTLELSRSL